MTTSEAAGIARVSRRTVETWCDWYSAGREDGLRHHRADPDHPASHRRIAPEDLAAFLARPRRKRGNPNMGPGYWARVPGGHPRRRPA